MSLVVLPNDSKNLDEALFPLHRQIEREYRSLPWPEKIQNIVVFTQVTGGRGDVTAAAKVIGVMQRICPTLNFDWILKGAQLDQYDPSSFLNCEDRSKVKIREWPAQPERGDFFLVGPVRFNTGYDSRWGPLFGFMENATPLSTFPRKMPKHIVEKSPCEKERSGGIYATLHESIFPADSSAGYGLLPMGLQSGSGVFLDRSRIEAPLSQDYYCHSYLLQIEDEELREDILNMMGEDQSSFNSGYAHHIASWGKFIGCVAIHERNRNVVIVLNQKSVNYGLTTQEFGKQIFTPELVSFLKQRGYGEIRVKGQGNEEVFVQQEESEPGRRLTVIVRPSFVPADMKWMQLASERLLATGDNSAVEAWCSRCKLYLYEDVANCGCKYRFLQQQVDLAQTISPNLARLLALFGGDRRVEDGCLNKPLSPEKMAEIEELLNDPDLGDATLQFCHKITENYSFEEVLEGALKRCAWTHCLPELNEVEADALNPEFKEGLIDYLRNPETAEKTLHVTTLPELGERIREVVQRSLCL